MRIIDLFSGAGGLTFGFYYKLVNEKFIRTDNEFIFANEKDLNAAKAFKKNFEDIHMIQGDIKDIKDEQIEEMIGANDVDIVIGGPPCQSFSTVGQRRYDDRAKLVFEYLRILKVARPKMFLFENVKGMLSMREVFYKLDAEGNVVTEDKQIGHEGGKKRTIKVPVVDYYGEKILDVIKREFGEIEEGFGYTIKEQVVNAVDFGVPQNRERVVVVGIRKDLNIEHPVFEVEKKDVLTIKDAISDLPPIGENQEKKEYTSKPITDYQQLMRGECKELKDHYCLSYGEKIRKVIETVGQGQGRNDFNKLVDEGKIEKKYYLTSGYANTYGRLEEDKPSTTITNNLATPSGLRCIHYSQNRALTPREGARIQSFPDSFEFVGSRTDITRQIGNAVPPLLAIAIARKLESLLGD
ncbi:MAG: DNA cytosine methyltransferase [Clostridia bacterium]|nr:DNA cytosine methyltransferase [Clostridia bacterium]